MGDWEGHIGNQVAAGVAGPQVALSAFEHYNREFNNETAPKLCMQQMNMPTSCYWNRGTAASCKRS